jgi:hypothetical protein
VGNKIHPKMDRENRAKQFMPFDALKGFREALAEKERLAAAKKELSEERKAELDRRLHVLRKGDMVTAEYFQNEAYVTQTGSVTRIDEAGRVLKLEEQEIPFDTLSDLRGDIFSPLENL